jgi:recombination protein RecR
MASPEIDALTNALARLPGLGPRSARRAVLHLIKRREVALAPLLAALQAVAANLVVCGTCGNVETSDPCAICRDPRRDPTLLCVVADVADLWALDDRRLFSGRYHVLGGRLSALDGVGPDDLAIPALVARAGDGVVTEVVLALSATMEGQATMHYVAEALAATGVKVSQLAQGLPMGGELDWLDEGTLALALGARRPVG